MKGNLVVHPNREHDQCMQQNGNCMHPWDFGSYIPTGSLLVVHNTISASEPDSKMVFLVEMA